MRNLLCYLVAVVFFFAFGENCWGFLDFLLVSVPKRAGEVFEKLQELCFEFPIYFRVL